MITVFSSNYTGNQGNCSYPNKFEITNLELLRQAVSHDYVCAEYRNNYRNSENFIGSNCLPVDCDNDHSEDPDDWVMPADVLEAFPGVALAIHYSRSHMREKNGKAARPKFHVLFPIDYISDSAEYSNLKKIVRSVFPYFDSNALDAARFFFGTHNPEVEIYPGTKNLTQFFNDEFDKDLPSNSPSLVIEEGSRNATMSRFAGRIIKRYGDTEEGYKAFLDMADRCQPPLDDKELSIIWGSAQKFFRKISQQDGYVPPDQYHTTNETYKPEDYSDVGQAEVLAKYFSNELRYSAATHYLRYSEHYWQESETGAQAVAHELTRRQYEESEADLMAAIETLEENGGKDIIKNTARGKAEMLMSPEQAKAYKDYMDAVSYKKYVLQRRLSKNITATLKEARPKLEIKVPNLDSNPFLLNTPVATYDLRLGLDGAREHDPEDYITKITTVSPSKKGEKIWLDCLDLIFCGNQELIDYVQMICGLVAIGQIQLEAMIIAYGCGRNGKSTFWNSISRVLGLYSGHISADTLTLGCKRNVKPEMAETKGKRLLIAAELQEGARLNDSTVKQLCATDEIFAEKKYKDPFSFTPSHTLVLYTNHLPKVSASDDGTWRRLIVIPFNAKIEGNSDIKNYGEYLYNNAGESILSWIIEGAKKVIELDYKPKLPKVVKDAIDEYRSQNDWFNHFIDDKCEIDPKGRVSSAEIYQAYRNYCIQCNEFIRSTTDFYTALEKAGYDRVVIQKKRYVKGLTLKTDFDDYLA